MTRGRSGTLLFVHNRNTRFVEIDRAILRTQWDVIDWYQRGRVVNVPALWRCIRTSDIVIGWFASWHTLLPMELARIARIPSVLIVGGYDVASRPDINYGHGTNAIRGRIGRRAIHSAQLVVTNSFFSLPEVHAFAGPLERTVTVIPHGVPDPWGGKMPPKPGSRVVLTVGDVNTSNLSRKGLGAFASASNCVSDAQFVLVGRLENGAHQRLRAIAGSNFSLTGYVLDEVLNKWYLDASVYVQLSEHEGFGMSVAEAMLAGCIPVVTKNGALPEVVGPVGIYVDARDQAAVCDGIQRALVATGLDRQKARDHILRNFPLERRAKALLALVDAGTKASLR